ncbi:class I SAM-dependent methyltransferase [Pseudomonas wadenswilerensis]|uniref:24-methylenesterol C-methyltransferase 2 n=1 Tax=Pseudomonas wadenswilerensis TaxID=1785161 RepID=A0A380T0J1_9PSED|nr:class I SAM-dependent methyltransferase [Pseudomonas wadenswilerensis]SUQ63495.1 24-methylenesterol C-methyltransferase 2 [Pseudomonas wadenswilerensis]
MKQSDYYAASREAAVYPHLRQAVDLVAANAGNIAVDVGCGAGRNTRFLLQRGFVVHAYDNNPEALEHTRALGNQPQLFTACSSFESFDYPQAALITASSSLFFCQAQHFDEAWRRIVQALRTGGIFCGHFMGPMDSWVQLERRDLSVHDRAQTEQLFDGFELLDLYEYNQPGKTLLGRSKHWHTYSVLARKTAQGLPASTGSLRR